MTFTPFPTALLAEHMQGEGSEAAGALYAGTFVFVSVVFNVMWRYAVRQKLVVDHLDVVGITRQYELGPLMYLALVALAFWSGLAVLIVSSLYALYFTLPPSLWQRSTRS